LKSCPTGYTGRKEFIMKTVNKTTVDELCRVVRKYWKTGDTDILSKKHEILCSLAEECYGNSYKWSVFDYLVSATFSSYGFKANATNGFYYDLLKMFDIEVVEVKELKA
jgi:hypothetical protein